jgi:hypothetical protein
MVDRGIRNNNPGNIDYNPNTKWQGLAGIEDPPLNGGRARFCKFIAPEYGIRALVMTLMAYQSKHDLHTIRTMIGRWAPGNENNTAAYIKAVEADTGINADTPIDIDSYAVAFGFATAIIKVECDQYVYPQATMDKGLHLAGIDGTPKPPLHKDVAFVSKASGGVMVAAGAVCQYAPGLQAATKSWAAQLADYTSVPAIAHLVEIITLAGAACVIASIVASALKQSKIA